MIKLEYNLNQSVFTAVLLFGANTNYNQKILNSISAQCPQLYVMTQYISEFKFYIDGLCTLCCLAYGHKQ